MWNFGVTKLWIVILMFQCFDCEDCIDTPEAYRGIFESVLETGIGGDHCVARGLMVSIVGPYSYENEDCPMNPNQKPDSISDGGNSTYWAWVSGSHNLEIYLKIAEKNVGNPYEAAAEMMRFVGYTEEYIDQACSYSLTVLPRENLRGLVVPTWASLFLQFEESPFNVTFDWDVARRLTLQGFSNFTGISGCAGNVIDDTCLQEYLETYNILSSIMSEAGTIACVEEFRGMFRNGESASLTQARAFFHGCIDANPLFTGLGYGYSATNNQLTEREYLARNSRLDEIGAASFTLYSPYEAMIKNYNRV
eukprot:GFUD01006809.1.p1 GENE.GFUD01006809.1~~GFUD01006809.1.p1  ORF type:complete len:307 (-),score=39.52 GFUD01006809.1:222-1142(-)